MAIRSRNLCPLTSRHASVMAEKHPFGCLRIGEPSRMLTRIARSTMRHAHAGRRKANVLLADCPMSFFFSFLFLGGGRAADCHVPGRPVHSKPLSSGWPRTTCWRRPHGRTRTHHLIVLCVFFWVGRGKGTGALDWGNQDGQRQTSCIV